MVGVAYSAACSSVWAVLDPHFFLCCSRPEPLVIVAFDLEEHFEVGLAKDFSLVGGIGTSPKEWTNKWTNEWISYCVCVWVSEWACKLVHLLYLHLPPLLSCSKSTWNSSCGKLCRPPWASQQYIQSCYRHDTSLSWQEWILSEKEKRGREERERERITTKLLTYCIHTLPLDGEVLVPLSISDCDLKFLVMLLTEWDCVVEALISCLNIMNT